MRFTYVKQVAALSALSSCFYFASADNSLLTVMPDDACVDLITGTDGIILGEVCTEVTGDNVVVTFNMSGSGVEEGCCLKETHICNMPPMTFDIEGDDGCVTTKVVPFSVMDVFGFMCSEPCDTFQFNGHATVICDAPLRGDDDRETEPGDPLPDDVGQGNYGDSIYCYGAMYDVGLECGPCSDLCEPFECQAPATPCGEPGSSGGGLSCYCSRDIENTPPNPEVEDFCWQDIGCFVPIFYLTTTPGVPCTSNDVCKAGTSCVPSTCCGDSLCLPTCIPTFGDKSPELEEFAKKYDIPMDELQRAVECDAESCTLPSGKGKILEYPESS